MKKQKGFTLVEAAVAIGVVAILAGIIVPLVLKNLNDARVARARNDIAIIAGAIARQLHDTGSRPRAAGAVGGGPTGAANAMWFSDGLMPGGAAAQPADQLPVGAGRQTFVNLFTEPADSQISNGLFGFGIAAPTPGAELRYKGPYLSNQVAHGTDPWGTAYVILGYNADGERTHGPIWVVSAGANRYITAANLDRAVAGGARPADTYGANWSYAGRSATNIAVRIN